MKAGTVFLDKNVAGTGLRDGSGVRRATRLAVRVFDNRGTYLKTGAGDTRVESRFVNTGTVRVSGSGSLQFAGPLDNRGSLDATGSGLRVDGPLSQWQAGERRLAGGRYTVRDGRLALNLGGPAGIVHNRAAIALHGSGTRLVNGWQGRDSDALSELGSNEGRLGLTGGAVLDIAGALQNSGVVEVGEGSRLDLAGAYRQEGGWASTWLDGEMQAAGFSFEGGSLGAGLKGEVGSAHLQGGGLSFEAGVFDVDVFGHDAYDQLSVAGRARLAGELWVDASGPAPALGRYRILVAEGGLQGRFDAVLSNLDPELYRVSARYGPGSVDIDIAAVPEPGTYVLSGLGLAAVLLRWRRRGGRATARPTVLPTRIPPSQKRCTALKRMAPWWPWQCYGIPLSVALPSGATITGHLLDAAGVSALDPGGADSGRGRFLSVPPGHVRRLRWGTRCLARRSSWEALPFSWTPPHEGEQSPRGPRAPDPRLRLSISCSPARHHQQHVRHPDPSLVLLRNASTSRSRDHQGLRRQAQPSRDQDHAIHHPDGHQGTRAGHHW
ncbi:PEP-CTERM sorting domain-containing protein [Aquabacterium sp. A7-Y]|uniref:PEP-CTERM sorting domain-containing protein n=1 Tax=Aquabacterium sp. A7-Y TaxID=1349605 RepID=UPI00223CC760|nr:PEP-CTERM sorting domain-containing protein [Aquabacterium sp. A7-Y]MCW7541927.1 PEP-CTERM sorting domain-containing protein [Aquabacterium sp. A7-Y]